MLQDQKNKNSFDFLELDNVNENLKKKIIEMLNKKDEEIKKQVFTTRVIIIVFSPIYFSVSSIMAKSFESSIK